MPQPELEVDGGVTGPAMHPEWCFRSFDEIERQLHDGADHAVLLRSRPASRRSVLDERVG